MPKAVVSHPARWLAAQNQRFCTKVAQNFICEQVRALCRTKILDFCRLGATRPVTEGQSNEVLEAQASAGLRSPHPGG